MVDPDKCEQINILNPDSQVDAHPCILTEDRTQPAVATLLAVNMVLSTEARDCYSADQISDWFQDAAIKLEKVAALTEQSSLVFGRKNWTG